MREKTRITQGVFPPFSSSSYCIHIESSMEPTHAGRIAQESHRYFYLMARTIIQAQLADRTENLDNTETIYFQICFFFVFLFFFVQGKKKIYGSVPIHIKIAPGWEHGRKEKREKNRQSVCVYISTRRRIFIAGHILLGGCWEYKTRINHALMMRSVRRLVVRGAGRKLPKGTTTQHNQKNYGLMSEIDRA